MANVGSGSSGKTLIGAGNGASPTFASIGTNSGLTNHGVVLGQNNSAFVATSAGTTGQVLTSNGSTSDPSFQDISASGAIKSVTPDTGTVVVPSSGNIFIQGQQAGTVPVMETIGSTPNLFIEDRSWQTQYVVDPSSTAGLRGTFQTIQAAINQALSDGASTTSPALIYIRAGTYVEDLTIYSGIHLKGECLLGNPSSIPVIPEIQGSHSPQSVCLFYVENIYFHNASVSSPTFAAASTLTAPFARHCVFDITGTGRFFDEINVGNCVIEDCVFYGPAYQSGFNIDAVTYFKNCQFQSQEFDNQSVINFISCQSVGPVVCTSGSVNGFETSFSADTTDNISGTGSGSLRDCSFSSNSPTTVAVSATGGTWYLNNTSIIGGVTGPLDLYAIAATPALNSALAGSVLLSVESATSYTVSSSTDYYVGITSTAAARTVTLPISGVTRDRSFIIKDESGAAATNNITITCTGGATNINGSTTYVINTNYGSVTVKWSGSQYFTI